MSGTEHPPKILLDFVSSAVVDVRPRGSAYHSSWSASRLDRRLRLVPGSPKSPQYIRREVVADWDEYVGYAERCVSIARTLTDRDARIVLREMAAEWTKLASALDSE